MMMPKTTGATGKYFLFTSFTYMLGLVYLGVTALVYLSVFNLAVGLILGLSIARSDRMSQLATFLLPMVVLAAVNIMVSTDQTESALRWALWLIMLVSMAHLASACDAIEDLGLIRLLPWGMFIIWIAQRQTASSAEDPALAEASLHLSAFFGTLMVATGIFQPNVFLRVMFVLVGAYGALTSGSRAAFILFPFVFLAAGLYYARSRVMGGAAVLLPLLLILGIMSNDGLRSATFGKKETYVGLTDTEDALRSLDDRAWLREVALDMLWDRPLGYGYGNTYSIPGARDRSRGTNFHNGQLNVGVAMGLHFMAAYIVFWVWLIFSVATDRHLPRLTRYFTLSVLICVTLRSATEDFTLFDLGNPTSSLVVFLIMAFVMKRRHLSSSLQA